MLLIGAMLLASMANAQTVTFTVNNDCNQTIYPAIAPDSYDDGGWTMAANTSVSFPVSSTFSGRVWARKNCNTADSPYACDSGSCGGSGAECEGSTGQGSTSLAEFTLAGSSTGTDWYDVSNVDAYDFPISITMSNGLGYEPTYTTDVISQCPAALQVTGAVSGTLAYCQNPCNVYATAQVCCTMQAPQDCRDSVNGWPATAQQYVNDIHNDGGEVYSYPWDDWWGLHTVQGGSTTWTITFCPNGVQPGTSGAAASYPVAPTGISGTSSGTGATITWTAVSGATSYSIYRSINDGGNSGIPSDAALASGLTAVSYSDSGLTSGTKYYYSVISHNATGFSPPSAQEVIVAGGGAGSTIPLVTTNLAGTATSGQVALTWTPATGATGYAIFRGTSSNGELTTPLAVVTTTSYSDTAVANNSTYYYMVGGVNSIGTGSVSNEINATPSSTVYPSGDIPINCGGNAASPYLADTDYSGGEETTSANDVSVTGVTNPAPEAVYQTNRYGNFTYTVPGFTASEACTVRLHFAETYFTVSGARTFNVTIGSTQVLTNFDIYATAGYDNANIQTFTTTANSSGQVVIGFVSVINNAQVNGIEVYPTSGGSAPAAPTGLTATGGNGDVVLNWSASSGATSYNVYRSTASGGEGATAYATGITGVTYTDTAAANGTAYYYTVAALDSYGTSPQSTQATATPAGAPGVPLGLTASAGNAQVSLAWTASSGATSYNVYRGTTSGGESATAIATGVTTLSYTNTGLTNGTTYYYKIAALDASGTSALSAEVNATPTAGTGAMVLGINCGGTATGSWVADEDYNGGTANTVTATINTANVTNPAPMYVYQTNRFGTCTYTVAGLTASTAYTVRLHFAETYWDAAGDREFNVSINGTQVLTDFDMFATAGGENIANIQQFSVTSNSSGQIVLVFTTVIDNAQINGIEIDSSSSDSAPAAPTGLTATGGTTQVALGWTASSGATSYNVYRGTASGVESATAIATGVTTASYTNTGLTAGTTYYYKVAALNTYGTSAQSTEASAITIAAAPSGLTATTGNTQVSLSWTASTGAASYNVYRGTTSGGESATPIATGVTTTSYTNTGLSNSITYYFKVAAVNASGTSPLSSEASATAVGAPPAPTGLTATAGNAQVALTWTAASGATSYNVYRGTASGGESTTAITTGITAVSYTNTGLTNGTAYYYKVAALDASGTSALSTEASATPTSGVPSAPTGVTATAGNAQVALAWTASSGATSYNVYRGTASGGESTTATATGITTTSYTNTGLTNGTKYYYTVKALNSSGTSAASSEVSATPAAATMVIGINAGGAATGTWVADTDYNGGTETTVTNTVTTTAVTSPAPEAVYQSNRYGAMTYTIGGLTASTGYIVRLHFAETYFDAAGDRTFNVSINSTQVLTNFDIFKTAGAENVANIQQFNATSNSSGQIIIVFALDVNQPQINGIEIDN